MKVNSSRLSQRQLFDKTQKVLKQRSRPRKSRQRHSFSFCGLFRSSCRAMITAQYAKGNGGIYRYYRCIRKKGKCEEPYIQEKELAEKMIKKL